MEDRKKWKENQATKAIEIPKTKRRKYEMNETVILNSSLNKKNSEIE